MKTTKASTIIILFSIVLGFISAGISIPHVSAESILQIPIELFVFTLGQQFVCTIVSFIIATPIFFIAKRKKYLLDYFSYVFFAINILLFIGALALGETT